MKKVAEMKQGGYIYEVFKAEGQTNPYIVKRKWYNVGWHTKTLEKWATLKDAMYHLADIAEAK